MEVGGKTQKSFYSTFLNLEPYFYQGAFKAIESNGWIAFCTSLFLPAPSCANEVHLGKRNRNAATSQDSLRNIYFNFDRRKAQPLNRVFRILFSLMWSPIIRRILLQHFVFIFVHHAPCRLVETENRDYLAL